MKMLLTLLFIGLGISMSSCMTMDDALIMRCMQKLDLSYAETEQILSGQNMEGYKCWMSCLLEEQEMMENGKMNTQFFVSKYENDIKFLQQLQQIDMLCLDKVKNLKESCEIGVGFIECTEELTSKLMAEMSQQ